LGFKIHNYVKMLYKSEVMYSFIYFIVLKLNLTLNK
jgi:hypothetical protein